MIRAAAMLVLAGALSAEVKTSLLERSEGFFPYYWDESAGKLWIEIASERWNQEFLYVAGLSTGVGSNDLGLDRGRSTESMIVRWERFGPKAMLVHRNYGYRASSANAAERLAVEEAFAQSVIFGGAIEKSENGRLLVDGTSLFVRDVLDMGQTLGATRQGAFKLDGARSAMYPGRTRNFPKNSEFEATLTFAGDQASPYLRGVAPTPEAVTVRVHHSFVELPDDGYQPRAHDARCGLFGISYMDFSAPVSEPIRKRYIVRHRLKKSDGKQIVYYLDRGAPEPIRTALLEGARWWGQAFEAAGFRDAFRVELMPEGADPLDVRYNVIQWVHRSTRGWSYGSTVTDPRTGEIIKGKVTLGSLRVRQDYLIAEGLLAPYEEGKPRNPEMEKMALARLRQLSAHEVGHTLGMMHAYSSSMQSRASVMDCPHPLVRLTGSGAPDLSNAYAEGIGEWDKAAIEYGYREFEGGKDDPAALAAILDKQHKRGLFLLSDADARPAGGASPSAHLWDNGSNAVDELSRMLSVRARVLDRFGENNIRPGAPMATLEEALVPAFLMHRYQIEAAAKTLGGTDYRHALRGDGQTPMTPIAPAEQRRALEVLLSTLEPTLLTLPERILKLIPPRPPESYARNRESFPARTGLTFDPVAAAESAASITIELVLHPERSARLVQYHAREPRAPGLEEVVDKVIAATWKSKRAAGLAGEVQRAVETLVLDRAMALANTPAAGRQVQAVMHAKLAEFRKWAAEQAKAADFAQRAHLEHAAERVRKFEIDPGRITIPAPPQPPPGQPIGCDWNY
jgi:hypothetical protein